MSSIWIFMLTTSQIYLKKNSFTKNLNLGLIPWIVQLITLNLYIKINVNEILSFNFIGSKSLKIVGLVNPFAPHVPCLGRGKNLICGHHSKAWHIIITQIIN